MKVGKDAVQGRGRPTEDRMFVEELPGETAILGVLDGHSGRATVEFMLRLLPPALKQAVQEHQAAKADDASLRRRLRKLFLDHDKLLARQGYLSYRDSGSTATVVIVLPTKLVFAFIGDSPACLIDPDTGKILYEIRTHIPTHRDEQRRILANGGEVTRDPGDAPRVNGALMVSRAFGDFSLKFKDVAVPEWEKDWAADFAVISDPEVVIIPRPARGLIAVMSDGLVEPASGEGLKPLSDVARTIRDVMIAARGDLQVTAQTVCKRHVLETASGPTTYDGDDLSLILADVGLAAAMSVASGPAAVVNAQPVAAGPAQPQTGGTTRKARRADRRARTGKRKLPKTFVI